MVEIVLACEQSDTVGRSRPPEECLKMAEEGQAHRQATYAIEVRETRPFRRCGSRFLVGDLEIVGVMGFRKRTFLAREWVFRAAERGAVRATDSA